MSARSVNSILTTTYWEIGRQIVRLRAGRQGTGGIWRGSMEATGGGPDCQVRARVLKSNLASMRGFYLGWEIFQTPSGKSEARVRLVESNTPMGKIFQTPSGNLRP